MFAKLLLALSILSVSKHSSALPVRSRADQLTARAAAGIGNFGSCSTPQIEFGVGFDGRKETSFEPVDKASFNHGSAQNIDIITKFICDTLTNSCGADQTAKDTCASAIAKADTGTPKTGVQADLFNSVFGITTNFGAVASVDDQGNVVAGTGSGNAAAAGNAAASASGNSAAASGAAAASSSGIGNFGSCSVPQIEFGVGFDGRKETSFEPVDKASFNHGSAQNIDVITQSICDTLTNSCGADQTAKNTCAAAQAKADTGTPKTGEQADLFNSVFGITTNFAAVASVDDTGNVIAGTGSGAAASSGNDAAASCASSASNNNAAAADNSAAGAAAGSGIGNFGSCSVPQIEFGVGFDGRKETSFEPVDKASFNHGSAQNIDIITKFICDTLTNSCGADQTAKDTCASAIAKADTGTPKTGEQADLFNSVFGITTNFAAVASVDDQGNVVAGTGSGAAASGAAASGAASNGAAASGGAAAASSSGIGNFGSCSTPQIEFGVGFDGRKETSFEPVDKQSFNHGSAQNIDIITKFICDTLTNSCGADQTAKDTCAAAIAKADTGAAKTGVQADLFNSVFGITTNFANVAAVDDQGRVVAGSTA